MFLSPQLLSAHYANSGHSGLPSDQLATDAQHKDCDCDPLSEKLEFSDVLEAGQVITPPVQLLPTAQNDAFRIEATPDKGLASVKVEHATGADPVRPDQIVGNNSFTDQTAWASGETVPSVDSGTAPVTDFDLERGVAPTARLSDEKRLVSLSKGLPTVPNSPFPDQATGSDRAGFSPNLAETVSVLSPQPVPQRGPADAALAKNQVAEPVSSASAGRTQQLSWVSDIPTAPDTNPPSRQGEELLRDTARSMPSAPNAKSAPGDMSEPVTLVREASLQTARPDSPVLSKPAELEITNDLPDLLQKPAGGQPPASDKPALIFAAQVPFPPSPEAGRAVEVQAIELAMEQPLREPEQGVLSPADSVRPVLPVTKQTSDTNIALPNQSGAGLTQFPDSLSIVEPVTAATEAPSEIVGGQSVTTARSDFSANHSVATRMIVHQLFDATLRAVERPVDVIMNPEELGKVRIGMVMAESGIMMNILAERPETLDLIRRHIDQLAHELRQIGYGTIGFTFGQHDKGRDGARAWTAAPEVGVSTVVGFAAQQGQRVNDKDAGLDIRV